MTTEKWWNNKLIILLTVISLVTTILLVWVLIMLYNTKTELNIIKENSWNAYDTAEDNYQKLRIVGNDVENILNQVSE